MAIPDKLPANSGMLLNDPATKPYVKLARATDSPKLLKIDYDNGTNPLQVQLDECGPLVAVCPGGTVNVNTADHQEITIFYKEKATFAWQWNSEDSFCSD